MELLKRRPIAVISVISIILMYLSSKISGITGCILLTMVPAVIATAIIFFLNRKNVKGMLKRIIYVIIFVAVSLTLSLRAFDFFNINHSMIKDRISKECIISGEVTDIGYRSEFSEKLYVNISSIDGERTDINAVLEIEGESHLYYGDVFTLKAKLEIFDEKEKYLIADGYAFKIVCEDIESIEFLDNIADERITFFRDLNEDIQDMIYRLTDEESGAFLSAIILGNRDLLEDNVIRDFRRCGISHILALSGLHVTVIIGFFDLVLRKMYVGKRIRCFILSFLGLAYLAITGFSMSASRAVIMLCMVYLSHLLHEDSDSITSLAIASVVILAINPYALVSVSLWMSVIATLGIIIISEIISPLGYMIKKKSFVVRIGYRLLTTASLTLAAIFFVSVFNWLCFGEISIVAPLTNLIITPLVTIVLVMGLTMLVFSFLAPIATFLGTVVCFLTEITLKLSEYFSSWHNITVSLEYDFVKYIAIPFIIAIIIFLLVRIKHKWTIALIPGAAVIAFVICLNIHSIGMQDMAKISYIQNGSSEMLLITDGESVTVCDISTGGYKHLLLAYETAEQKGSTEIDNVILTHYHNYHPATLLRMSKKYMIRNVFIPEPEDEDDVDVYNNIRNAFLGTNVNVVTYRLGYEQRIGDELCLNISPEYYIKRSKHPMFMISIKRTAESDRNELLYFSSPMFENPYADYPTHPDYIIVGAHGPVIHNAPSLDLIETSRPSILLLADGERMLADDATVERLETLRDGFDVNIVLNKEQFEFILE